MGRFLFKIDEVMLYFWIVVLLIFVVLLYNVFVTRFPFVPTYFGLIVSQIVFLSLYNACGKVCKKTDLLF